MEKGRGEKGKSKVLSDRRGGVIAWGGQPGEGVLE